jgi:hypothetical protein
MRMKDKEFKPLAVINDIRNDPRWQRGHLDRFAHQVKNSTSASDDETDPCDLILNWFGAFDRLIAIDEGRVTAEDLRLDDPCSAIVVSGRRFAAGDLPHERIRGVLLEHEPENLTHVARQFHAVKQRPMLMHAYLPGQPALDFVTLNLPRAVPILPILIRSGEYVHGECVSAPPILELIKLLAVAMGKKFDILPNDEHE